jgi:polar amino acid transport system substrate-binding protein
MRACHALAMALCAAAAPACADEALTIYYNERPPYLMTAADGSVAGLTATPAARAVQLAGLQLRWSKLPTNRQLAVVKDNKEAACAIGWFRNAEREAFAKFSQPLYQDRPTVALARGGFQRQAERLADELREHRPMVLLKDGFSYGPFIDGLMKQLHPPSMSTTVENSQMVRMIAAQRADFMYVSEEEAGYLIDQAGLAAGDVKIVRFADMPAGERRHLMCTRLVPDEWMARINRALPAD